VNERLIRRGGKLYHELQDPTSLLDLIGPDPNLQMVIDEMAEVSLQQLYFGSPNQPAECPVCGQQRDSYWRDERGLLFRHARRAWLCRWSAIEATQPSLPHDNDEFVVVPDQFR